MNAPPYAPRYTIEERIKFSFPRLYMRYLLRKHWRKGEPELKLLPQYVPPGKAAIDVGANKGVYTYHLSRLCTQVHAFEPNPKMHRVLRSALPKNAITYTCALSDRDGTADLMIPLFGNFYSNATASLNPRNRNREHGALSVETRTLDSFNFADIGFIKIDVEGFEKTVLLGAKELIRRERPVIQVEMEEQHTGEPIEASHAFMDQFDMDGYFAREGRLLPLSAFDPDKDHRLKVHKPGYVNNFIFKPRV